MKWTDLLRLACRNLAHTGIRAWLCLLAVCIGMTSVSTVFSVGAAAQQGIAQEIDRIGISGLAFYSKQPFELQQELLDAVKSVQTVSAAMPMSLLSGDVRLRNRRSSAGILGIDAALGQIFHLEVLYGALPSQAQVANREKLAVIDAELARSVYHRENIVGKQISLTVSDITDAFTICAVISSQSANLSAVLGSVLPCVVYVPYTALEGMTSAAAPDKITVAVDGEDVAQTAAQIQQVLQRQTSISFLYENLNQYLSSFTKITGAVTALVSGIAAISMVVGGIGVMNTMVASVDARMQEIGIYRALGARKRDILLLFLTESVILCVAGGLCGMGVSQLLLALIGAVMKLTAASLRSGYGVSFGCAAACGVLFGILPAYRAARLDPIQAIRHSR